MPVSVLPFKGAKALPLQMSRDGADFFGLKMASAPRVVKDRRPHGVHEINRLYIFYWLKYHFEKY